MRVCLGSVGGLQTVTKNMQSGRLAKGMICGVPRPPSLRAGTSGSTGDVTVGVRGAAGAAEEARAPGTNGTAFTFIERGTGGGCVTREGERGRG